MFCPAAGAKRILPGMSWHPTKNRLTDDEIAAITSACRRRNAKEALRLANEACARAHRTGYCAGHKQGTEGRPIPAAAA